MLIELNVVQLRNIVTALSKWESEEELLADAGDIEKYHRGMSQELRKTRVRILAYLNQSKKTVELVDSDVPYPVNLSPEELVAYSDAVAAIVHNMAEHATKRPKMTTLMEEVAEAILASRGKHDDPLELELTQIAGICGNMLWQIATGADVCNLRTQR